MQKLIQNDGNMLISIRNNILLFLGNRMTKNVINQSHKTCLKVTGSANGIFPFRERRFNSDCPIPGRGSGSDSVSLSSFF